MDKANLYKYDERGDIAIVGMSVYCPGGDSLDEFWHNLSGGADCITEAPPNIIESFYFENGERGSIDRFYCSRGGFCPPYKIDPLRYGFVPITVAGLETEQLYSLAGVEQALIDAGIPQKKIPLANASIIIGRGGFSGEVALRSVNAIRTSAQIAELVRIALPDIPESDVAKIKKAFQDMQGRYQADSAIGTMPNLIASLVANKFDMHGPAYTVDGACASALIAVSHSAGLLRSGQCDVAVAGGTHLIHNAMFWSAFNMMGAMSQKQRIAPFSADADGLLIGQGAGYVVLKTLRRALEDSDRVYAVIKATSVSSDGGGSHVMVTSTPGQKRVLDLAWSAAGMDRDALGYIEAHGTATPVGDRTELTSLTEFFGGSAHPEAYVGSVKSNIGHAMPAAGIMGLIKTTLALHHRQIPPTLHCETPLAEMAESRFTAPVEPVEWDGERLPLVAGVNAFGFGGINSHAILTAYVPPKPKAARRGAAKARAQGQEQEPAAAGKQGQGSAAELKQGQGGGGDFADLRCGEKRFYYIDEAIALSAPNKDALIKKLEGGDYTDTGGDCRMVVFRPDADRVRQAIRIAQNGKPWRGRMDIWFSNRPLLSSGGKTVFLFPGYNVDMESEVASIKGYFGYGLPDMDLSGANAEDIQGVMHFYTMMFNHMALADLGVDGDMYVGHSIGEWHAARAAGLVSDSFERETSRLVARFRDMVGDQADAERERIPRVIAISNIAPKRVGELIESIPGLYLANDNCPGQVVMSALSPAKDALAKILDEEKIFYQVLDFYTGFHTPLMDSEQMEWVDELVGKMEVYPTDVQMWSSSTLARIPTDRESYAEHFKYQICNAQRFRELIEKLYAEEGARVFIQIGLGKLTGFVENTLHGREFGTVVSSSPGRVGVEQLRQVLALLFVEGRSVDAKFLGVKPQYRGAAHSVIQLPMGSPIIHDFPLLAQTVQRHYVPASQARAAAAQAQAQAAGNAARDAAAPLGGQHAGGAGAQAAPGAAAQPAGAPAAQAWAQSQAPQGQAPQGQAGQWQAQQVQAPQGRAAGAPVPQGQAPFGGQAGAAPVAQASAQGQASQGQAGQWQAPQVQASQGRAAGAPVPQGQALFGGQAGVAPAAQASAQGQAPQGQARQGQAPQGQAGLAQFAVWPGRPPAPAWGRPGAVPPPPPRGAFPPGAPLPPWATPPMARPQQAYPPGPPLPPWAMPPRAYPPGAAYPWAAPPGAAGRAPGNPAMAAPYGNMAAPGAANGDMRRMSGGADGAPPRQAQPMQSPQQPAQATQPMQSLRQATQPAQQAQPARQDMRQPQQPQPRPAQQARPAQPMQQPAQQARPVQPMQQPAQQAQPKQPMQQPKQPAGRAGAAFEQPLRLTLEDHPYLLDHAIVRQPEGWIYKEDLNPVVPFTMTLELLAEIARERAPGRKIVKISSAKAYKWMSVETPFEAVVSGAWKSEDRLLLAIKGYADAEFTFADSFPEPPPEYAEDPDLGEALMPPLGKQEAYEKYAFHGPAYHSNENFKLITAKGMAYQSRKTAGKASLLDGIGQGLGLYLHLTQASNTISFPTRVREMLFYQDMFDQDGLFDVTMLTTLTDNLSVGDFFLRRGGKLWLVVKGWVGQRFENDRSMWNVLLRPQLHLMARELAPEAGAYYYSNFFDRMANWMMLAKRYLNYPEMQRFAAIEPGRRRLEFLIGMIALKDAARKLACAGNVGEGGGEYAYPVEIFYEHDGRGKPYVRGVGELGERLAGVHVSLARKGSLAVAIASGKPVGIDLELIGEQKEGSFMDSAFAPGERALLGAMGEGERAEWAARLWVAKVACAKMLGTGLGGDPRQFEAVPAPAGGAGPLGGAPAGGEVSDPRDIAVRGTAVRTVRFKGEYIAGWTL
ncbi:MAG: acyltransferase domain-containing protein [Clostridiales bacterium]|jgi:acyl transferase domain-containing protein/phosphopantetheinyl transferase (holo-ACP synthase)|nr:acyltransferase domain-containing protein [Clostridiales bacterium]